MTVKVMPPSPEHIPLLLKENFVTKKLLKIDHITEFKEIYNLHKRINHGEVRDLPGNIIDEWQTKAEEFFNTTMRLIKELI